MKEADDLKMELEKTRIAYQEAIENSRWKAGFLARIAHEIRSPLSSLMSLHQLIINDLCEDEQEEKEFIVSAYQYARKLMGIIDQLVEVSKLEAGRLSLEIETVNLKELLRDVVEVMNLQAENRNLKLVLTLNEQENLAVKTDRLRITNMLFFLLETVIAYCDTGEIVVTAGKDKGGVEIVISFPPQHFPLCENIDLLTTPIEELKDFNRHPPKLSPGMRFLLADCLLSLLGGRFSLKTSNVNREETIGYSLFLPSAATV
ncbi:MAG: HAMP domain-containing histidine kinase [Geminocystis sp.]|nr:HAMP domain-containing histidine kinase [Geminocystis sp.]MCS7148146.1 HAMP domain-containing histidine kinase [Geminocystis sp.]MDW8116497.1 HAMP domain-containing sensor histidine kinase [Geminocystis sp.]MDW8462020.1 HAMP domain-containing sensor histidine kinase [Geminocystis sp.]